MGWDASFNGTDALVDCQALRKTSQGNAFGGQSISQVPRVRLPLRLEFNSATEPVAKHVTIYLILSTVVK
jgi:hypothetical protein